VVKDRDQIDNKLLKYKNLIDIKWLYMGTNLTV